LATPAAVPILPADGARAAHEGAMARIAVVVDDQFEDSELRVPYDRLRAAGHELVLVGLERGKRVKGKRGEETFTIDRAASEVRGGDFDALVIPGGYSPDHLRTSLDVVRLTRDVYADGKPVAAVCHGPWLLVEAEAIDGRTVTSWPSLKTDLKNAGAKWVDQEVVTDKGLVSSRKPADIPAFSRKLIEEIREGAHQRRAA
jgi:protease I